MFAFLLHWRYVSELSVRSAGSPFLIHSLQPLSWEVSALCSSQMFTARCFGMTLDMQQLIKFAVRASFWSFETVQSSSPTMHMRQHRADCGGLSVSYTRQMVEIMRMLNTFRGYCSCQPFGNVFPNNSIEEQLLLKRRHWRNHRKLTFCNFLPGCFAVVWVNERKIQGSYSERRILITWEDGVY